MEENLVKSLELIAAKDNGELLQVLSSQELLDDAVVWVHKHQDGFQDAKEARARHIQVDESHCRATASGR